jgi:hypothetical protein
MCCRSSVFWRMAACQRSYIAPNRCPIKLLASLKDRDGSVAMRRVLAIATIGVGCKHAIGNSKMSMARLYSDCR